MNNKVLVFIDLLRESHKSMESIFLNGSCLYLFDMLKLLFPEAEAYYDGGHVATKINGLYYDITGIIDGKNYLPIEEYYGEDTDRLISELKKLD